jgi:hypothetical protein
MQFSPTAKYLIQRKLFQTEVKAKLDSIFFAQLILPQTIPFSRQ